MKKIVFLTVIFALIPFMFCSFVYAKKNSSVKKSSVKKIATPKIEPLIYKGIKFVVPNTVKEMGYVQAWDVKTGLKVWEKKVYNVTIFPFLAEDTQWVFIISLSVEDGKLIVVDEKGREYKIGIPKAILKD
ncbi:MAG: hypothetical protein NTX89_02190 [Candidatus Omnitrophica bacterium]|nr:hypothetical protein [Candidatus Omnitrophota bacterium]